MGIDAVTKSEQKPQISPLGQAATGYIKATNAARFGKTMAGVSPELGRGFDSRILGAELSCRKSCSGSTGSDAESFDN
jgi:hypothetical protein